MTGASGWGWAMNQGWGVAEIGDAGIPGLFLPIVNQISGKGDFATNKHE